MKTIEEKAKAYDEGLKTVNAILNTMADSYVCTHLTKEDVREMYARVYSELRESEGENLKNKSGYYKAGKFWKASTLWNAVNGKSPQRVPNRYILQECTWNISSLQHFADEVKNVQEVDLNYPIILDMNGNILDGAHRVVKAYLEGKDIDIVYLGDDEWPEPDYDEEKAVKESEDERIRKCIGLALTDVDERRFKDFGVTLKDCLAYLEKQKEQKPLSPEDKVKHPLYVEGFEAGKEVGRQYERVFGEQKPTSFNELYNPDDYEVVVEGNATSLKRKEQEPIEFKNDELVEIIKGEFEGFRNLLKKKGIDYEPQRGYWEGFARLFDSSAREYVKEQKPSWSEEDEKMLADTIFKLAGFMGNEKNIDWLKSRRPSWKPSEEQMKALERTIHIANFGLEVDRRKALESLYEQLKKL